MEQFQDLEEKILETIPHGSGIDGKWNIGIKGNVITCNNSFHLMDENGFYSGWKDFCFYINLETFAIRLTGGGNQAGDCIYETLEHWFSQNKGEIAKVIGIELIPMEEMRLIEISLQSWRSDMIKKYSHYGDWPEWAKNVSKSINDLSMSLNAKTDYKGE